MSLEFVALLCILRGLVLAYAVSVSVNLRMVIAEILMRILIHEIILLSFYFLLHVGIVLFSVYKLSWHHELF